jgi:ABC-type glycerol-3-phosphate transport system substrate-binding protein
MTPVGAFGGWNLAIFETSPNQEAAWKFIQFMTREDVNGDVVDLIPANIVAAEAFLQENRVGPERIMEHLNNAKARPLSPQYLEVSDIQVDLYQQMYNGADIQTAADEACAKIDALQ